MLVFQITTTTRILSWLKLSRLLRYELNWCNYRIVLGSYKMNKKYIINEIPQRTHHNFRAHFSLHLHLLCTKHLSILLPLARCNLDWGNPLLADLVTGAVAVEGGGSCLTTFSQDVSKAAPRPSPSCPTPDIRNVISHNSGQRETCQTTSIADPGPGLGSHNHRWLLMAK